MKIKEQTSTKVKAVAQHPLAGKTMTGAEMAIQVLADEGVDTVFGYSGGAILPTYDAIFRYNSAHTPEEQIRLVVPANEQGAGFMAAGYARASGKVGVFIVTSGPGATNCVTPIRDCMADSIPVVLLCGQVPKAAIGSDAFQEAPVYNIMSACAKHVFLVSKEEELEATVRTAFEIARSGRPGPVVIDMPKDVQNYTGEFKGEGYLEFRGYEKRMAELRAARVNKEEAAEFFRMLGESERPLIYAGGGIINSNAADELRAFAKRFQIPVVTTLMGIGAMDTDDELALHMLGMHGTPYANYAVEDCDFLIAVGSRFDDRVAGKVSAFAPKAKHIAHIDIDAAEIGKVKSVHWAHAGDAQSALRDLIERGKAFKKDFSLWVKYINHLKTNHALNYDKDSELIQPQQIVEVLSEITGGEAIVCTGVGQHQMWAAQYGHFHHPRTFITSGSMGTMGFGLPAAIGAQLACKDRVVIDIDGDGSIRMNLGELETATTYDVPVKVLLLNNLGDGMVRQWQTMYFGTRFSGTDKSLHKKDFVKAAEADGFGWAKRLSEKAQVRQILEEFVKFEGPAFLEVLIDPNAHVYPMVGPGMGYGEMVTGDHIKARGAAPKEHEEKDMMKIPDLF
ncbi:MAG: biosynthetic-type acetolactate synthase large subunit [FCB group bacterium]|jgi:acetolactate synthase-1/2/3 large subunit|nr:biosynthetic-type acetolactate synthase large subunit [FCB group bacterium]